MTKQILKSLAIALLFIVGVNIGMWLFNNVNAWLGIVTLMAFALATILIIVNSLNQKENEKK